MKKHEVETAATLFRALSDPGRLSLLLVLRQGEKNVSELVALSGSSLVNTSARLRELYRSGLIARRKQGRNIFYSLNDSHVSHIINNACQHASQCVKGESYDHLQP